jgi:dihydrofolate reductase
MKIMLDMAVSLDGYVAKNDGDSDWVSPAMEETFVERCQKAGCIIVGRKTFEQYRGKIYPVKGVVNIVLTTKNVTYDEENVLVAKSPRGAIALANGKGFKEAVLAGGGMISGAFANENLIDEAFLAIHPLALGEGISLFAGINKELRLKLVNCKDVGEDVLLLHYKLK